jgi:hypothetical protein
MAEVAAEVGYDDSFISPTILAGTGLALALQ